MRVVVQHRSRYPLSKTGAASPQLMRLRAADHTRARIESYQLLVEPEPHRAERRLCGDTIRAADVAEGSGPGLRSARLNGRFPHQPDAHLKASFASAAADVCARLPRGPSWWRISVGYVGGSKRKSWRWIGTAGALAPEYAARARKSRLVCDERGSRSAELQTVAQNRAHGPQ